MKLSAKSVDNANIVAQKRAAEVRALAATGAVATADFARNTVVPAAKVAGEQAVLGAKVAGTFVVAFGRALIGR